MKKLFFGILFLLLQFSAAAQQWESVGGGANTTIRSMYADTVNNRLYVCGEFNTIGGLTNVAVAYWDGTTWNKVLERGPWADMETIFSVLEHKGDLVISGAFEKVDDKAIYYIARNRAGVWEAFGNPHEDVQMFEFENELYIKSQFDSIDSLPIRNFAKWTGTEWVEPFADHSLFVNGGFSYVTDMVRYKNQIIVGGNFDVNGMSEIALFDGTNWQPLGMGLLGNASVEEMVVYKDILYIGGWFTEASGNKASYLVAWNGQEFFDPFPDVHQTFQIFELEIVKDELYITGSFYFGAESNKRYSVAKFDGSTFCALGGSAPEFNRASILRVVNDEIYVTAIPTLFGDTVNYIAHWTGTAMDTCIYSPVNGLSENSLSQENLQLSPNPAKEQLTLSWSSQTGISEKLYIRNSLGQVVQEFWIATHLGNNEMTVDVSVLNSGIYWLSLGGGNNSKLVKL